MARISSGKNSKQDYQTPKQLIEACEKRFGKITLDLAARDYNSVCERYIAPCTGPEGPLPFDKAAYAIDSFDHSWYKFYEELGGVFWLNCEFGNIKQWAKKCAEEAYKGANILLLIPYGTTDAFMDYVVDNADLYLLKGRLQFISGESFPKDCVICHYYRDSGNMQYYWDWKENKILKTYFEE